MTDIPAIKFPQSPFVDNKGNISREWRQWLLNPQFLTLNLGTVLSILSGGTGLGTLPGSGQLLIGDDGAYTLGSLTGGTSIQITLGPGSITIAVDHIDAGLIDSGTVSGARMPAFSGDISTTAGSTTTTLATVNSTPGSYGDGANVATYTVDAKGRVTVSGDTPIAISSSAVSGLGTMAAENSNSVSITGGSIDGTSVGGGAPSTVKGTTITATGALGCNGKAAQTSAAVNAAIAGTAGVIYTATEQGLINSLLALTNQLRAALVANGIAV